jgi:hypothetical protein
LPAFNVSNWGPQNYSSPDYYGPANLNGNTTCYFKAYRGPGPDYDLTETWFHILAAKGAFVLVFEVRRMTKTIIGQL